MNLADIRVKAASELTAEDKAFLKEHKSELTQEEVSKFSEALDEGGDKGSDQGAEDDKGADDKGEEGAEDKGKREMREKGMVKISASELESLRKNAAEGVQANTEIRKMKFSDEVKAWSFNETTKKGKMLPKSKDKVVTFMMSLNDSQLAKFREIVGELPDSLTFAEVGDSGNTEVSAAEEVTKLAAEKQKENPKLSFREALDLVSRENLDLIKRQKEEAGSL